jgi:hypothetical protein
VSENAVSPLGAGAVVVPADSASTSHSLATRATGLLALAGPLLALGLGSFLLGRRPLTIDEADTVAAATGPFTEVVERALEHDPARAGYLALLQPVVQLDDGERWVRAPSVIAAALGIEPTPLGLPSPVAVLQGHHPPCPRRPRYAAVRMTRSRPCASVMRIRTAGW